MQSESALLPARLGVSAVIPQMSDCQQQQVGEFAGGDRADPIPDGAGRLLQRDHSPPRPNRRHDGPKVTQPPEKPPPGSASW